MPRHNPMPENEIILKLAAVGLRYETASNPVEVLKNISLEVSRGESLAIIGPSGSGKSSLLNLIGSLDRPTSGDVLLTGRNIAKMNDVELALVRNRDMGFIFQSHHLLPQCSVVENVLLPTLASSEAARGEKAAERAERLLKRVGLGSRMTHRPAQLSGGERQRVAVVRALINQPQLLLADEPTGALDRASAEELTKLLLELNREEGVTLIVVTHALDLARKMGRMLELREGKLQPAQ